MNEQIFEQIKSCILIDDNDIDNFINKTILNNNGIDDVKIFTTTTSALSFIKNTDFIYPLILLDIQMPKSDGFDFIDNFYGLETDLTKVIILSSFLSPTDREKALLKNIKIIEKPLTIEKLIASL